ncbi:MAG: hypothetical protein IJE26_06735 [Oscillospiraceae bacterium]|nr:hypothetical protein [Oscillospiraceae bacterium]
MIYKMEKVRCLSVGTTAVAEELCCQAFLIENNSDGATVYFREKDADGVDCTAENGYALGPGERLDLPLCARELSLVATAQADVRLMILE